MPRGHDSIQGTLPRVPRWATAVWASVWAVALLAPAVAGLGEAHHPALAVVGLLVLGGLFVVSTVDATTRRVTRRTDLWPVVAAQAVVTAALLADAGLPWGTLATLLAISVGASVRLAWAPWLVGATAVAAAVADHARGAGWDGAIWSTGLVTLLAGLLTCAFSWLAWVIAELRSTRQELARTAVAAERLRFSRDLHDLLGHSLSVISVKAQAARRAAATDPDAAARHAGDIEALSREALAEVRQVVQGYRRASLDAEVARAAQALQTAGIHTAVVREESSLTPEQEDLLAWVVREGATNVLRHAGAGRATIRTDSDERGVTLEIEDDGGGPDADEDRTDAAHGSPPVTGSGLAGLRERLTGAGGTLSTHGDASGFRLSVRLPHTSGRIRP